MNEYICGVIDLSGGHKQISKLEDLQERELAIGINIIPCKAGGKNRTAIFSVCVQSTQSTLTHFSLFPIWQRMIYGLKLNEYVVHVL